MTFVPMDFRHARRTFPFHHRNAFAFSPVAPAKLFHQSGVFANAVTLQGTLIPAITARKAETEVILRDGESFAIAGLIDNRVQSVMNKVKGLGDIPILGFFFRSKSMKKTNDELLVVVTPRFVKPVPADEKVKLPDMVEAFMPTLAEEQAAKIKKPKDKKPKTVGESGYQKPKK